VIRSGMSSVGAAFARISTRETGGRTDEGSGCVSRGTQSSKATSIDDASSVAGLDSVLCFFDDDMSARSSSALKRVVSQLSSSSSAGELVVTSACASLTGGVTARTRRMVTRPTAPPPLFGAVDSAGRSLPFFAIISPRSTALCATSESIEPEQGDLSIVHVEPRRSPTAE
jgi:hypothetical protein